MQRVDQFYCDHECEDSHSKCFSAHSFLESLFEIQGFDIKCIESLYELSSNQEELIETSYLDIQDQP